MSDDTLPHFLVRTGPASYTLTLSASAAETLMLCPAKYSWSRVTGIEAAAPRAGMNYGKALHLALAHRHGHMELSLSEVEEQAQALLTKHFAENPQPQLGSKGRPEWRTLIRAMQAFAEYNKRYPAEDFEALGVEEPFEVVLGELRVEDDQGHTDTIAVIFRGIRDLRVRWHDQLWVLDHKTSTEWSDLVVDEGKASFQFQGYAWVERKLRDEQLALRHSIPKDATVLVGANEILPVGGVIGNYLISRAPYEPDRKPQKRDLPRDQFERVPYPYSDAQLDEWHGRALRIAKRIWQCWSEGEWDQHSTACAHWGKCEYYRLCWETDPDYRLAAAMGADYRPRTPSPFEDESNGKERT